VNDRDAFLQALAKNQDDNHTRLVYADWLDEHGEHEESDRQRKWPAAREWLVRFCKEKSPSPDEFYQELLQFGQRVVAKQGASERIYFDNHTMWDALKDCSEVFWKNWSILTGMALPASLEEKGFHIWRCCSHEVYYWFGKPDPNEEVDHYFPRPAADASTEEPSQDSDESLPEEEP
jgi:uncharacterized protein (TIGR02996 family)